MDTTHRFQLSKNSLRNGLVLRRALSAALVAVPLALPSLSCRAADVTVNVNSKKQEIDGFGASSAWCGKMSAKANNNLYNTLGYSILRVRVDETEPNWATASGTNCAIWNKELSNAKAALAAGATVFATPWNPPASLRITTGSASAAYSTDPTKWAGYRDYLNTYVKYFKDNGAPLDAIAVQNEPDYAEGWTNWSATQVHDFIVNYGASINTKLITAESFSFIKSMYDQILNDSKALANVAIFGAHFYGTPVSQYAYPLFESKGRPAGKRLWMTEHFLNRDDDITKTIMPLGKEIHDCMVTGNFNAYVYWWIFHPEGILADADSMPNKRGYTIAQFAKYIRPGYYRVDATPTPATNVYVSAYAGGDKVVIVAVNTGTSAVSQKFSISGASVASMSTYQTSSSKNLAAGASETVSGGSFTTSLPAQSITTFVGANSSSSIRTRLGNSLEGFTAVVAGGALVVSPSRSVAQPYTAILRTIEGRALSSRSGSMGSVALPLAGKATYVLEVQSNGRTMHRMVPVL